MKLIGVKTQCHICGERADTVLEKCKLDCDGIEHEFCVPCSKLYRMFRANLGKPEGNEAFKNLQDRRAAARVA